MGLSPKVKDSTLTAEQGVAALYAQLWDEISDIHSPKILEQFLLNIDLPKTWFLGKVCLDVGCGSGFAVWAMQELGGRSHACDLNASSLARVAKRLAVPAHGLTAASALQLPFNSESFDFVHCNGVLHHTRDPRKGFRELVRVTRPGGTLFVSLYGRGGVYGVLVATARALAPVLPHSWVAYLLDFLFGGRTLPNSFMPAKVSVLDNMYVPIRHSYSEDEIRNWFVDEGFSPESVVRTTTTLYDHQKALNRLIHGEGYLQFRAIKPLRDTSSQLRGRSRQ